MQLGDLVSLKNNPNALGIVVSLHTDIYNKGDEYHEKRWDMATVLWNGSLDQVSFEIERLEVIG
tara:strand:- start:461 stop:652 length:192 start_codon:yes stop_codon:yes gene_type:complete